MQFFMRMSKLSNIVGRADYISNPARQEHIVLARSYADWKPYQEFERTHRKSSKANNEGRELIIALPNEWGQLGEIELASRMNELAQQILPGKTEYQWAIHWNKAHTNLHVHLIFSERNRQYTSSGVWDRDIYLTQDGKVARRKADRAVDRNGKVKPPVHRKGEPKDAGKPSFSPKDTKFKNKKWLNSAKCTTILFLIKHGVVPEQYGVLHQHHEGKGSGAAKIQKTNADIRKFNQSFKQLQEFGFVLPASDTDSRRKMIRALLNPQRETGFFDTVYPYISHQFEIARLPYKREILRPLMETTKAAGVHMLLLRDAVIVKKQDASQVQRAIDDLIRQLNSVSAPPAPKKQEDTPKVVIRDLMGTVKAYQEEKRRQERAAKHLAEQQADETPRQTSPQPTPIQTPAPPKPQQLKPATPAAASQPSKPVDPKKIIALRDDYFRKALVWGYLETAHTSTSAQQSYVSAQKVVSEFDTAAKQYNDLNDQIRSTFNPIKKMRLRSDLDDAAARLGSAAYQLNRQLGINLICDGRPFDSSVATKYEINTLSNRIYHPLGNKRDAAEGERKRNEMIQRLSAEKVTADGVREALAAFEKACKSVPEEQRQAVFSALCGAATPGFYEFEQSGYISKSRRAAKENISRIVSAIKPATPVPQHDHRQERERTENMERDLPSFGFHR